MRIMNQNLCTEDATVITASSVDSNFPVSNLKNPFRSKRWRSTGVASESLVFDMITTEPIDSVILLWSKEDGIRLSETAVVTVQANATNVWTSPAVNQVLTINNTYMMASHYFGSAQNYRYWRILIQDAGNPYGYLELGVAWMGMSLALDNAQNGFKYTLNDQSVSSKTPFGHVYVDEYPQLSQLDFQYQYLDYDQIQTFENAYRQNGTRDPVMVIIDADATVFDKDHFVVYGKFKNTFANQHVRFDILNTDGITVLELA